MQECEVEGEHLQLFTGRIQEMQLKISDLTRVSLALLNQQTCSMLMMCNK